MAEGELEQRIATLETELRGANDKHAAVLKTHVGEVKGLKDQIAVLKDSTKVCLLGRMLPMSECRRALSSRVWLCLFSFE